MQRTGKRITELGGFLCAMSVRWASSGKAYATARLLPDGQCEVWERFSVGTDAYDVVSPVAAEVFQEALRRSFINPKPEQEEVSKDVFVISRNEFLFQQIFPIVTEWLAEHPLSAK